MQIKLYIVIQNLIVPFEARMVTVVLGLVGIQSAPSLTSVNIGPSTIIGNKVTISWNCIGWQSFILLLITLATGLQGSYRILGKIQTLIIGIFGTFLLNILRVSFVIIIAQRVSPVAGLIFHDYFSTLMVILWLFLFWWFSYNYVLERQGNATD